MGGGIWDKYAEACSVVFPLGSFYRESLEVIAAHHQGRRTIIDEGCGPGLLLERLAQEEREELVGVDSSGAMLKAAKSRLDQHPHVRLLEEDASCVSLPDNYAHAVNISNVLCYLDDPLPVIREAKRLLRPGGVLTNLGPREGFGTKIMVAGEQDIRAAGKWQEVQHHWEVFAQLHREVEASIKHEYNASDMERLLYDEGFSHTLEVRDDLYLGECYFVAVRL